MAGSSDAIRVLFVDDEESIRLTLPRILEQHGCSVVIASSVPEALVEINSAQFDVLLADLNIDKEGDGFLVVSAMRHIQPACINLILTGFPGFETALQAIQTQVDDYFIKPADIETLVTKIKEKLGKRKVEPRAPLKRLPTILTEYRRQIIEHIIAMMNADPKIPLVEMSDEQRVDHLPQMFNALTAQLEKNGDEISPQLLGLAAEHARRRKKEGYDVQMVMREIQLIGEAVHELMQTDLMPLGLVGLTSDLGKLTKSLDLLVIESVVAFEKT